MSDHMKLFEVFIRSRRGLDHKHVGSLHAEDAQQALEYARDVYTRRSEGVSIWVVNSSDIVASQEGDCELYDPLDDKSYRRNPLPVAGRSEQYVRVYTVSDSKLKEATRQYAIRLGDDALVLGHRLSEWCSNGPFSGGPGAYQCRRWILSAGPECLQLCCRVGADGSTEDTCLRDCREFSNLLIHELPVGISPSPWRASTW